MRVLKRLEESNFFSQKNDLFLLLYALRAGCTSLVQVSLAVHSALQLHAVATPCIPAAGSAGTTPV